MLFLFMWSLLQACVSPEGAPAVQDSAPVLDTDTGEPVVTEEDAGGLPEPDNDWVYSKDVLHQIDITLPQSSWDALLAEPYVLAPGQVTIDGLQVPDIGLRLRGKIGSFRPITGKPKLKLDFNAFSPGRRFFGLEAISLNNSVVDCGFLKDPLGYRVMEMAGVPASRTAFAQVTVNGADYGLYVMVETQDDRYLKRNFADGGGNLYDGKYVWYGGGNYTLLDFVVGVDHLYSLEEGQDVGNEDIFAITTAVGEGWGTGAFMQATDAVLDWPQVHRLFAAEQWIRQNDGYVLNTNNTRVYFDPADGKAELLPWDLDYSFMGNSWSYEFHAPRGVVAAGCLQDSDCVAAWREAVVALDAEIDVATLQVELAEWRALIWEAAVADPRRECGVGGVEPAQQWLADWLVSRPDYMRSYWGL